MNQSTSHQSGDTQLDQSATEDNQQVIELSVDDLKAQLEKANSVAKSASEEAKKNRQIIQQIKSEKETAEKQRLEAEGKWQELAKLKEQEALDLAEKLKAKDAAYAFKNIETEFVREASQVGCLDTRALIKLVDLRKVSIDDSLNVDTKSVKALVEEAQKSMSYLFKSKAPTVNDLPNGPGKPADQTDFSRELRATKNQAQYDAVMRKHGKL